MFSVREEKKKEQNQTEGDKDPSQACSKRVS